MYLNILKKDLKRKRTMNIILLIFITLAVMFVSSSANNISAVTSSLDNYFDKAGVADYIVIEKDKVANYGGAQELVKDLDCVTKTRAEDILYITAGIETKGEVKNSSQISVLCSIEESPQKFFDVTNKEIKKVKDGEVYFRKNLFSEYGVNTGDKISIKIGNVKKTFTIAGPVKDATFGGTLMGTPRFVVSQNDYNDYCKGGNEAPYHGKIVHITTSNTDRVRDAVSNDQNLMFQADRGTIKITYLMEMLIAGVLLIVSICLILIAFVVLRFTITFTLSEEYREIGIMKAIGINNRKIRGLYIVKYLAMSAVGAVVGFLLSIPFSKLLLDQVSDNILISSRGGLLLSIVCGLLVVGVIILFCYGVTKKVKRFTPVDAIRSGQTGERYRKKGLLKLNKSRLRPVTFMAFNDILSGLKKYSIMLVTFTISLLLMGILLNTLHTLQSDSMVTLFSIKPGDVYLEDNGNVLDDIINPDGREKLKNTLADIKQDLKEKDIPADVYDDVVFQFIFENAKGKSYNVRCYQGINTNIKDYEYTEGTPPVNKGEIAITRQTAAQFKVGIGDTLTIFNSGGEKDYIITAYFQTMNNIGDGIRFNEAEDLSFKYLGWANAYQVKYTDNPSAEEIEDRFQTITKMYRDKLNVLNTQDFINSLMGGFSSKMFDGVKFVAMLVVFLISLMVVVLMEKSFLTKERGEIAVLKAMGFKNRSITLWQALRVGIVMIASVIIFVILSNPVCQVTSGAIFKIMGAESIVFVNDIFGSYILIPAVMLVVTVLASAITAAVSIKSIKTSEMNSIE